LAPIAAMLGGLALHALGFVAQQTRISILAFLLFAWGVARLAGGRRWGDAAMFPLGFMMFAIPISVLDEIGLPLRLWVTTAGEHIAHLAGIDVVRSGTQLVAPDGRFNYDVAAPCSGVRSLMALTALSVLIGYLNFRSWWRRTLIVALCFPLVYLGNVCRIVAIVFAAQAGGPEWGDRAHEIMGYGVFVIVLGGVMLAVAWIHRWWPEAPRGGEGRGKARRDEGIVPEGKSSGAYFATAAVVSCAVAEMFFLHRLTQMPSRAEAGVVLAADGLNPVELPAFLGTEWIGQRAEVSATERDILPADTGFSRKNYAFVGDRKHDVFLSIVLSGRDRTSIHRPELCLVGQGWTIEGAMQHSFRHARTSGPGGDFRATVLRVRREVPSPRGRVVVPQLVAYWFVGGDSIVASHWQRFLHDAWNRVTRARADRWAYVLMQTDARDGEAAALARMQAVLDGTLPVFQKSIAPSAR
jgi:EpsI family protein